MAVYHAAMMKTHTKYINMRMLAGTTGLPLAWLETEAKAGRIPCLLVGRRLMFDMDAIQQALAARAAKMVRMVESKAAATVADVMKIVQVASKPRKGK